MIMTLKAIATLLEGTPCTELKTRLGMFADESGLVVAAETEEGVEIFYDQELVGESFTMYGDLLGVVFKVPAGDAGDAGPASLNSLRDAIHAQNKHWWTSETGEKLPFNIGEKLMLVVSEVAEAMEGARKNLPDSHLPHRSMLVMELADAVIRLLDLAGGLGLDIGGALYEKLQYNKTRVDHTREARAMPNGKKF